MFPCRSEGLDEDERAGRGWDKQLHAFIRPPGMISPHPVPFIGAWDVRSGWRMQIFDASQTLRPVSETFSVENHVYLTDTGRLRMLSEESVCKAATPGFN